MSNVRLPSFVPRRSSTSVPLQRAAFVHLSFTAAMRAPVTSTTPGTMVSVAGGTTVNAYVAGVGSVLPSTSRARTWNVCAPRASAGTVNGDEQARRRRVHAAFERCASLAREPERRRRVDRLRRGNGSSVVSGAVASIVKLGRRGRVPVARLVGRPHGECVRPVGEGRRRVRRSAGDDRSRVDLALERGELSGDGEAEGRRRVVPGRRRHRVDRRVGREVSTVKAREAGVASTLPASSVARTWNVCAPSASAEEVKGEAQGAKRPRPCCTGTWRSRSPRSRT